MVDTCSLPTDIVIPSLILQYIFFIITLMIIGLTTVKNSKAKFMLIWGLTTIFGLVILVGIALMPNVVEQITTFVRGLM